MHPTPSERMDGSMYDHPSKLDRHQLGRQTLAMPVTTALKVLRGWRYVALMVSNWAIAVFAGSIALSFPPDALQGPVPTVEGWGTTASTSSGPVAVD